MFKLRPFFGLLTLALFVGVVGSLLTAYFLHEDAYRGDIHRWVAALLLTIVFILLLVVSAFSRYFYAPARSRGRCVRG